MRIKMYNETLRDVYEWLLSLGYGGNEAFNFARDTAKRDVERVFGK